MAEHPNVIALKALTSAQIREFTRDLTVMHQGLTLNLSPEQIVSCQIPLKLLLEHFCHLELQKKQLLNKQALSKQTKLFVSMPQNNITGHEISQKKAELIYQKSHYFSRLLSASAQFISFFCGKKKKQTERKIQFEFQELQQQELQNFLVRDQQENSTDINEQQKKLK